MMWRPSARCFSPWSHTRCTPPAQRAVGLESRKAARDLQPRLPLSRASGNREEASPMQSCALGSALRTHGLAPTCASPDP